MEANLVRSVTGLVPETEGWFVVSAREARWWESGHFGAYCVFEGDHRFTQFGINVTVLEPGQSLGRYHAEPGHQEDFLVVAGECVLIMEDESRELGAWDFVHCPPGTAHMIVGAGDGPSTVVAVGTRGEGKGISRGVVYPVSDVAAAFGVSVARHATDPGDAYADVPEATSVPYRGGWLPTN